MLKTLPGESILVGTNANGLTITDHRVIFANRGGGSSKVTALFLEDVTGMGLETQSSPALRIIAAFMAVIGVALFVRGLLGPKGDDYLAMGGSLLTLSGIFLLAYYFSRRQVLFFASSGGRIELHTSRMTHEHAAQLISVAQEAKNARGARPA